MLLRTLRPSLEAAGFVPVDVDGGGHDVEANELPTSEA